MGDMTALRSRSLAGRLETGTRSCDDVGTLAQAVFDTLTGFVPFVFACLATTDPATGVVTRAFKSHPLEFGSDEDFAAAEYGRPDVNLFAEIARRPVPVGVLSIDTDGDIARCHRLREFMIPVFGFTDELRLACRIRDTTWGALALYRGPGEPPFTEHDGTQLASVQELIAERIARTLFTAAPSGARCAPAVIIVDARDQVTDASAEARQQIEDLGGWDHGSLPANLLNVAALARTTGAPVRTRVPARSGRWLALRAMPLDGDGTTRSVVLSIDAAPLSAVGEMTLVARGLTTREQEVARLVLQGAPTKDIAATLFLSPHTVQDHLKAIFAKLGVSSRREMIARLVAEPG